MSNPSPLSQQSVRSILRACPDTRAVFERHGLMGCGGEQGPDEPLEFFARVHHVSFDALLAELSEVVAAASRPAPAPAPAAAAGQNRRFVPFLLASLAVTLSFGATLGMINLVRLTTAWWGGLPRPSVWAHAYAQVFGFVGLFVMGIAYHVMPRFASTTLREPRLVAASFWLQLAGVLSIAGAFLGPPAAERVLWMAGSGGLLAAAICFAASVSSTLASGRRGPEPFEPWVLAGCAWLAFGAAVACLAAISSDTTWHYVLWPSALYGFAGSWILGVGRRIFPVFLGWQTRRPGLERLSWMLYQVGVLGWSVGAWPGESPAFAAARAAGALALLAAVALYIEIIGLFRASRGSRSAESGYERYIYAAWGWLLVGLATGPLWTVVALATGRDTSITMLDFSRHAVAFGFVTQMMMGVASRVLPVFTGNRLWSPRARDAAFWLLNAGIALRGLEAVVAAGYWPSAWNYIALSGPPAVAAVLLFAANVAMTLRGAGAAASVPAPAAANVDLPDRLVADILTIPGALEVLVAAGFTPLANPVLRAALARTVTLRQACGMTGAPLEAVTARLEALQRDRAAGSGPRVIPLTVTVPRS